jgi:hypothetical protein
MLNFGALLCGGTLKMNAYFVHLNVKFRGNGNVVNIKSVILVALIKQGDLIDE